MENINKRFNLIGFDFNKIDTKQHRHCVIHIGRRLVKTEEVDVLLCPECGIKYPLRDTALDQGIQSKVPPTTNSGPRIITAKTKKKYTDSMGNPIPEDDREAINDIRQGKKVVY